MYRHGKGQVETLIMSMSRPYLIWYAIRFGGILALILYPLCKARF